MKKLELTTSIAASLISIIPFAYSKLLKLEINMYTGFYVLISLCIGLIVFIVLKSMRYIINNSIRDNVLQISKDIVLLDNNIKSLGLDFEILQKRKFIRDVIEIDNLARKYPPYQSNLGIISTEKQIKNEIELVRKNIRENFERYQISLDFVEEELKRIYGPYYTP